MNDCKGLLYRCEDTAYVTKSGWEHRTRMRLLKRMSCPGCEHCYFLLESLSEDRESVQIKPEICDGGTYRLKAVNLTYDYESGYCDGWDTAFVLVEEGGEQETEANPDEAREFIR